MGEIKPYADHWEHLLDELGRLDLRIRIEMERMAIREEAQDELTRQYAGIALTREEMVRLLDEVGPINEQLSAHERMRLLDLEEELQTLERSIYRRSQATAAEGRILPLERIVECYGLDRFERDAVIVAAAVQVDEKYSKLYGFLLDDATSRQPTVALTLRLLCTGDAEFARQLPYWLPTARLRRHRLIALAPRQADAGGEPMLASYVKLDDGVIQFLLQPDQLDDRVRDVARLLPGGNGAGAAGMSADFRWNRELVLLEQKLAAAIAAAPYGAGSETSSSQPAFLLLGQPGCGRVALAAAACAKAKAPLMLVDLSRLPEEEPQRIALLELACREALLRSAVLGLLHAELLQERADADRKLEWQQLYMHKMAGAKPTVLFSTQRVVPKGEAYPAPLIELSMRMPDVRERAALWQQQSEQTGIELAQPVRWMAIAEQYKLTSGGIGRAWQLALALAQWREAVNGDRLHAVRVTEADIREACQRQSHHGLDGIATRILPQHRVENLVLPIEQTLKIQQIIAQLQQRHRVLTEWNFHRKLSRGKGTNVLFAGPPGTGKTMAAEAIAGELGLDLYRIDLSQIISKYIGETEKNLGRLFAEAENSNAILLFDEADALFGKRSEVKDSHDRHANTEVAYLLQKMEEYDGMSILATNLQHNMDEAFARRMAFRIEFPIPEEQHRFRLWQAMFPSEAPRSDDIDYTFLARSIQLAGGNIKNAVLAAAYLASEEDAPIGMRHLIRAVKQELDKLGKLCLRSDFGPYYEWIS
ncbi:AAA ATPase central domain protein [Paenibacillus curdlanolyticus YK9]|uniref:AAA ATPase central domain protein n=1 Tax=Paenibacillus curdlanolyticus YK9 TaxID=717606 RepID=E0I830_9BACL|nr:ATP-binding protein [Paenibacillus curdlanolyticus]EFM11335.1 AAA ATPase central domain protein [Paenibacillus curdlanolyticus YK9]